MLKNKSLTDIAFVLLLLSGVWPLYVLLYEGWSAIVYPYPLDYGEGPILDQVVRLSQFHNIYNSALASPPYVIANYPPLFQLVQCPFVWIFGPAYWYGRAISLLSIITVIFFVASILYTLTKDRLATLACALTVIAIPYVPYWSSQDRVDTFALMLSWAALWMVVKYSNQKRSVIAAAILLIASIYTRQTYALSAPLTAFVWLYSRGLSRAAIYLLASVAGLSLIIFLILNGATHGGFYLNIISANVNPLRFENISRHLYNISITMPYLLLFVCLFLMFSLKWRPQFLWFICPYLLAATLVALTIAKSGSNVNYLLELSVAFGLSVGAVISLARIHLHTALIALLICCLAGQLTKLAAYSEAAYLPIILKRIDYRADVDRMMWLIRNSEAPVLADFYAGLMPLSGRRIYFQSFELKQLSNVGKWNEQPFLDALGRAEFPIILIEPSEITERWTPRMLQQIKNRYRLVEQTKDTLIYVK